MNLYHNSMMWVENRLKQKRSRTGSVKKHKKSPFSLVVIRTHLIRIMTPEM